MEINAFTGEINGRMKVAHILEYFDQPVCVEEVSFSFQCEDYYARVQQHMYHTSSLTDC